MKSSTITWAQNGEDIVLRRALCDVKIGFYIDVGAADPEIESVTKLFYDQGWNGINIEPNEDYFAQLVVARPRDVNLGCAISTLETTRVLNVVVNTGLSTFNDAYAEQYSSDGFTTRKEIVNTRTLDSILAEHGVTDIHFLKIDVEGHEEEVVRSIDLSFRRPWIILYEATEPNTNTVVRNSLHEILNSNGYEFVMFDGLNKYFVASEHASRSKDIFPINVLDNAIRSSDIERDLHHASVVSYAKDLERAIIEKDKVLLDFEKALNEKRKALAEMTKLLGEKIDEKSADFKEEKD
jgi:FkbM family methyltransferase